MNISAPEYYDENGVRAFPLSSSANRLSTGGMKLPDSLLVGAQIDIAPGTEGTFFFVKSVTLSPEIVSVTVARIFGGEEEVVATVTIPANSPRNTVATFVGGDNAPDVRGHLVFGDLQDALEKAAGVLDFSPSETPFEASVMWESRPHISFVSLVEGHTEIARMSGWIRLVAGRRVVLSRVEGEDGEGVIRIDANDGANLDDCGDSLFIKTINGVGPNDDGEFFLNGDECINISATGAPPNSLKISDLCCTACCGCDELESLVDGLKRLETQHNFLQNMAYRLSVEHTTMIANMVTHLAR